jgi:hypothetical protein
MCGDGGGPKVQVTRCLSQRHGRGPAAKAAGSAPRTCKAPWTRRIKSSLPARSPTSGRIAASCQIWPSRRERRTVYHGRAVDASRRTCLFCVMLNVLLSSSPRPLRPGHTRVGESGNFRRPWPTAHDGQETGRRSACVEGVERPFGFRDPYRRLERAAHGRRTFLRRI